MQDITHKGIVERIIIMPSVVSALETTNESVIPRIAREKLYFNKLFPSFKLSLKSQ